MITILLIHSQGIILLIRLSISVISTNSIKNKLMKNVKKVQLFSLIVMMAFIILPLNLNAQGKPDFSGTWTLNAQKSDQPAQGGGGGGMRMGGGGDFVAKQEANLLTVNRTRNNPNGEAMTTTSKYTLDGKESVNSTGRGESKSVATWSGNTLNIKTSQSFDMGGETRAMNTSEAWTLTDAKTLSVKTTRTSPNGDVTTTAVYDKK
jgi:hypothetical protein